MIRTLAILAAMTIGLTGCAADSTEAMPSPSPSASGPSTPISFSNLDPEWVSRIAWDLAQEKIAKSSPVSVKIKYRLGPSLSPSVTDSFKAVLDRSAAVIGDRYVPKIYNATYFGAADADWVDNAIADSGADIYSTPSRQTWSSYVRENADNCRMASAGVGSKGAFINRCITEPMDLIDEITAHEYFHLLQSFQDNNTMPVWLSEGGATFFGTYVAPDPGKYDATVRDAAVEDHLRGRIDQQLRQYIESEDADKIYSEILKLTKTGTADTNYNNAYYLGMIMSEALVAVGGWDKWVDFNILPKGSSYEKHFKSLYGIALDEFYEAVSLYIASQHGLS